MQFSGVIKLKDIEINKINNINDRNHKLMRLKIIIYIVKKKLLNADLHIPLGMSFKS